MTEIENIKKYGNNRIIGNVKILETSLFAYKEILGVTKGRKLTPIIELQQKEDIKTYSNEIKIEKEEQKISFYSNFKYFDKLTSIPEQDDNDNLVKEDFIVHEILHDLIMNL